MVAYGIYFDARAKTLVEKALETVQDKVLGCYKCNVSFALRADPDDDLMLTVTTDLPEGDNDAVLTAHAVVDIVQAYILGFIVATNPEWVD